MDVALSVGRLGGCLWQRTPAAAEAAGGQLPVWQANKATRLLPPVKGWFIISDSNRAAAISAMSA